MAMRLAQWLAHGPFLFVAVLFRLPVWLTFFVAPPWCGPALLFMPGHAVVVGAHVMYFPGGLHLDASRESNKTNPPPWFNTRV